jgi:hypothetical protein
VGKSNHFSAKSGVPFPGPFPRPYPDKGPTQTGRFASLTRG